MHVWYMVHTHNNCFPWAQARWAYSKNHFNEMRRGREVSTRTVVVHCTEANLANDGDRFCCRLPQQYNAKLINCGWHLDRCTVFTLIQSNKKTNKQSQRKPEQLCAVRIREKITKIKLNSLQPVYNKISIDLFT